MARKLVDISVALQAGLASDPPHALPEIEYRDHHMTAPAIAAYFGVGLDELPTANTPPWKSAPSAPITAPISTRPIISSRR